MNDKLRFRKGTWKKRTISHIQSFVTDLPSSTAVWASRMADNRRLGALGERIYRDILLEKPSSEAVLADMLMVLQCLSAIGVSAANFTVSRSDALLVPYAPQEDKVYHSLDYVTYWNKATIRQFKELMALISTVNKESTQ